MELSAGDRAFARLSALELDARQRTAVVLMGGKLGRDEHARALVELSVAENRLARIVPGPPVILALEEVLAAVEQRAPRLLSLRWIELSVSGPPDRDWAASRHGIEEVKLRLGDVAQRLSTSDDEPGRLYHEARALFASLGDVAGAAECASRLGDMAITSLVADEEAVRWYREACTLYREVGDAQQEAHMSCFLGHQVQRVFRDDQEAWWLFERGDALSRALGDREHGADAASALGSIAARRGDHEGARMHHEAALRLSLALGDLEGSGSSCRSRSSWASTSPRARWASTSSTRRMYPQCVIAISPDPISATSYVELQGYGRKRSLTGYAPGTYWVRACTTNADKRSAWFGPFPVVVK